MTIRFQLRIAPTPHTEKVAFFLVALLSAALFSGCASPESAEPLNVLVVMVDTLRADHLGVYGYDRATSPHLDRFARDNILFSNARSQAPCTFPSVNSALTSRRPHHFLGQSDQRLGIPARFPTLASILRDNGYRTLAVSASPIVRKTPSKHNPHGGFDRGFDLFDERCSQSKNADCINQVAFRRLRKLPAGQPFLLYLHYMDPHDPYHPPKSWDRRFASDGPWHDFVAGGDPNPIAEAIYRDKTVPQVSRGEIQHLADLYDEEIRYLDERFQKLLDRLDSLGLAATTMVVVMSDHGEEFLEHGHIKHCKSLHDTQIRTPLFMRIPGVPGPREVPIHVENLDVLPTILHYLGIDRGGLGLAGRQLAPLVDGAHPPDRASISSWDGGYALAFEHYKLISDPRHQRTHLFDLADDPEETTDLWGSQPVRDSRLLARLEDELRASQIPTDTSDRTEDRLRTLGYLE